MGRSIDTHGLESAAAKRAVVRDLLPILARIPEAVVRADYVNLLATTTAVTEAEVREDLARIRQRRESSPRDESKSPGTFRKLKIEDLEPAERDKLHIVAVLLNALGLTHGEEEQLSPGDLSTQPLRAEQRECINRVVDLIPDRDEYPLSVAIKRLLSIKPRTYKNMAALLEESFGDDSRLQTILALACEPELVPIGGDRDRMLMDAAHNLEERQRRLESRRLTSSLLQQAKDERPAGLEESREYLRQQDTLHGLGNKKQT
jgi:DNA primase